MSFASIPLLQARIAEAQARIARLQSERDGLERFFFRVGEDEAAFCDQAWRKRQIAERAGSMDNVRSARSYAGRMAEVMGWPLQSTACSCFDGVRAQVEAAIRRVEEEIAEERRAIARYEDAIAEERARQERQRQREAYERRMRAQRDAGGWCGGGW